MASTGGVPTYLYPEDGAQALARVVRHVEWRARPAEEPPTSMTSAGTRPAAAIAQALGAGEDGSTAEAIDKLLGCYGIPTPAWRVAADPVGGRRGRRGARRQGRARRRRAAASSTRRDLGAVRVGLAGGRGGGRAAAGIDEALASRGCEPRRGSSSRRWSRAAWRC